MILAMRNMFGSNALLVSAFRFNIYAVKGKDPGTNIYRVAVSELKFVDASNKSFKIPNNATITTTLQPVSVRETTDKLFDNDYSTKYCTVASANNLGTPALITVDFSNPILDITKYNRWQWYTADDGYSFAARNPKSFSLEMKIGNAWRTVDAVENYDSPAGSAIIGYEGVISL